MALTRQRPVHHTVTPIGAAPCDAEMARAHETVVHVHLVEPEVLALPVMGEYADGEAPAGGVAPQMVLLDVINPLTTFNMILLLSITSSRKRW